MPPLPPEDVPSVVETEARDADSLSAERTIRAADLRAVKALKVALTIPVLTNGNVRNAAELLESLASTGCDGVMTAEAALDDPAIFMRHDGAPSDAVPEAGSATTAAPPPVHTPDARM